MCVSVNKLFETFESLNSETVHSWIKTTDFSNLDVLDIGCGSGRDAAYIANHGARSVVAVDKSEEMLRLAKTAHQESNIKWINDSLPNLRKISESKKYDFILCSAVLMFLDQAEQVQALQNITKHLKKTGRVVITVKKDPKDSRVFSVNQRVFESLKRLGYKLKVENDPNDSLLRTDVSWKKYFIDKL